MLIPRFAKSVLVRSKPIKNEQHLWLKKKDAVIWVLDSEKGFQFALVIGIHIFKVAFPV